MENHYLEAKREVGTSKSSNIELARDLAQFAIDGGTLITGVEENKAAKKFDLAPFEVVAGFAERVESIRPRPLPAAAVGADHGDLLRTSRRHGLSHRRRVV